MEELRLLYEHLMRQAFHCERREYKFTDADYYDQLSSHLTEAGAFMLCALINLSSTNANPIIADLIRELEENEASQELIDSVLQKLYDSKIIF